MPLHLAAEFDISPPSQRSHDASRTGTFPRRSESANANMSLVLRRFALSQPTVEGLSPMSPSLQARELRLTNGTLLRSVFT